MFVNIADTYILERSIPLTFVLHIHHSRQPHPRSMSSKSVKPDKLLAVQQDVKEVQVRTNKISLDLESHKRNVRKQQLEQKRLEMKGWCVVSGSSVPAKMKGEKITPLVTMLIQKAFNVSVPFSEIQDAYRLGTNRRIMVK